MSQYIDDIYQYCDQWCARCPFTERCAVYTGFRNAGEVSDPKDPEFWKRTLQHFCEVHNLPPDAFEVEVLAPEGDELAEVEQQAEEAERRLQQHALVQAADCFSERMAALLDNRELWMGKGRVLAREATLGLKTDKQCRTEIQRIAECYDVLCWYHPLICVKAREAAGALQSRPEEALEPGSGAQGTAKVLLLAAEKAREALLEFSEHFPGEEEVLPLLAGLERISRQAEATFCFARAFVRPGFDEVEIAAAS